ncbi:MAG: DUF3144 domain-containing protein, partial [Planctomycetota bacterium]
QNIDFNLPWSFAIIFIENILGFVGLINDAILCYRLRASHQQNRTRLALKPGTYMDSFSGSMKIDFTKFEDPIDGLTLSDWTRNASLDISSEDAALAGIDIEQCDNEYELTSTEVDFQFTPNHRLKFDASSVVADVRSNKSLRSFLVQSKFLAAEKIFELARLIVQNWNLHCLEENDDEDDENAPRKIDAIAGLSNWRTNQPNTLPSFLAQSDPNPFPGLWFFRLVVNPSPKGRSLYGLSIQTFWRDVEFDKKHKDNSFWDRADAIINLANDQSADESISRVANSLLYAAARFNAFDYWTFHENAAEFTESRQEAVDDCMERFRKMLEENFDDHLERFVDQVRRCIADKTLTLRSEVRT